MSLPIALFDDLVTPTGFALGQACQAAVGIVLSIPDKGWPDLDPITRLLREVPPPVTYADAFQSAALLGRFLERAAVDVHLRVHGSAVPVSCPFEPSRYVGMSSVDQRHPESWNAASIFASWSCTFLNGLAKEHRQSVAARALARLRAGRGIGVNARELARELGCSVPVLRRAFRRATGCSLRQYAIHMRVDRAIELLRETDWKIEAITREVGWRSKKDLHAAFARLTDTTPGNFRRLDDDAANHLRRRLHCA